MPMCNMDRQHPNAQSLIALCMDFGHFERAISSFLLGTQCNAITYQCLLNLYPMKHDSELNAQDHEHLNDSTGSAISTIRNTPSRRISHLHGYNINHLYGPLQVSPSRFTTHASRPLKIISCLISVILAIETKYVSRAHTTYFGTAPVVSLAQSR